MRTNEPGRLASYRRVSLAILALISVAGTGCGGGDGRSRASRTEIRVSERDFKIAVPRRLVRAGDLSLSVLNKGPEHHELIVIRKSRSGLPLRADGLTVDEDAIETATAGALEPSPPGTHRLRVRLAPGRYELICNMAGHYLGGMRAPLVVQ